jgi:hypothetical protein
MCRAKWKMGKCQLRKERALEKNKKSLKIT